VTVRFPRQSQSPSTGSAERTVNNEDKETAMNTDYLTDAEKCDKVFVYGTLLLGQCNQHAMSNGEDSQFLGEDWLDRNDSTGYVMYSLGAYPGVVEFPGFVAERETSGNGMVRGEVYSIIRPRLLARLDRLEGHPHFYERKIVTTLRGFETWVYLLKADQVTGCTVVKSGRWHRYNARRALVHNAIASPYHEE